MKKDTEALAELIIVGFKMLTDSMNQSLVIYREKDMRKAWEQIKNPIKTEEK